MGHYDSSLTASGKRVALACGLYGSTRVQTAFGWQSIADLHQGDLVMTQDEGLSPIVALNTEFRRALWSVRIPANALGNPDVILLPPGQSVLIKTEYAMPFSGDDLALVPATALEGWRGIAPHVPALGEAILQMRLHRPAVLFAGPGIQVGCQGSDTLAFDLKNLLQRPSRPVLPLAAARQMVAHLVAEEASAGFLELHAADLRPLLPPPPNLS